jgi:lipoprotein-anchoring transpeptidase ErfK/SrfK
MDEPMPISRRYLLAAALSAGLLPPRRALALSGEPFPVFASDVKQIAYKYRRREVEFETSEPSGTIVVDPRHRFLYFVMGKGKAMRFGVGVGKAGKSWSGEAVIKRKAKWPVWVPTPEHLAEHPELSKYIHGMPGGKDNPMGARALYLYQGDVDTVYRIHGTLKTSDIGRTVTAGCISMLNIDVIYLYDQVEIGTKVVVLP